MSLKDVVNTCRKSSQKSNSSRTPAYYNKQKNNFIHNMCTHSDPIVRAASLASEYCPANSANTALLEESDVTVVRTLLLAGKGSVKTLGEFIETPMAGNFDDDEEVKAIVSARISGTSTLDDSNDEDLFSSEENEDNDEE